MRVVIAPDSFKESMTAAVAAAAMARGVARAWPRAECVLRPLADGGEGTLDALVAPLGAERLSVMTRDAVGRPVAADYALVGRTAIIEVATVIGLGLVPVPERRPLGASTVGLAAVIAAALDAGAEHLIVGLGGTATSDGGAGLLAGLGARLLDADGAEVSPDPAGLSRLVRVELSAMDRRLAAADVLMASDVTNPLLGADGAAAVFAPQKGASPAEVPVIEAALMRWADALVAAGLPEVRDLPGSGAAGGLGAALLALGAQRGSGFGVVADAVGLRAAVADADLVLTGEGSLDAQTASGKAPAGVLALGRECGVPVMAFAGRVSDPVAALRSGFTQAIAITPAGLELTEALRRGPELLERAVATVLADATPSGR